MAAPVPPDLWTDLDPDACAARLNAITDDPWSFSGGGAVIGKVKGAEGRLRRRTGYYNSLHTEMVVMLKPEAGGTRIRCRTGLNSFALIFLAVWAGIILLFMLGGLVGLLTGQPSAMFLLIGPVMLGFMAALVAFSWGQGDDRVLVRLIRETLQARDIAAEAGKT